MFCALLASSVALLAGVFVLVSDFDFVVAIFLSFRLQRKRHIKKMTNFDSIF